MESKEPFLVSCNLKTKNYKNLRDDHHQGFSLNQSLCQEYLHGVSSFNMLILGEYDILPLYLFQLVLPQWMESMPCPPQLEMMDTTSLLAYVSSLPK
ncbi:unnamed protein product [Eruca vesicaria subsp. sativa]|uniref:F-box protein At3g26010-like beta-propeller domain-containing protein n=1 Tax=Eruca vesicaria subsp. sativa TaxID=29727 RepID=A0ABC8LVD2_ERUVS|nr:unnamed protein product [Eruca vesicaria subsp. sativa]